MNESHFDRVLKESLPHWFLAVAAVSFVHLLLLDRELHISLLRLIIGAGPTYAYFKLKKSPLREGQAHAVFLLLVGWVLLGIVGVCILSGPLEFYHQILLLLVGIGMVGLRVSYTVVASLMVLCTWGGILFWLSTPPPLNGLILAVSAIFVTFHSLRARRLVLGEQFKKKALEWQKRSQLQEALRKANLAKAALDYELDRHSARLSGSLMNLVQTRKKREATHREILHSNRLDAVGRLAGGLAHRLNNQFMVVQGNLDCLSDFQTSSDTKLILKEMLEAITRSAKLTSQLVPITGKDRLQPKSVKIEELLQDLAPTIKRMESLVHVYSDAPLCEIVVDPTAWFQVLTNLLLNADQANRAGGHVLLSAREDGETIVFSVEDQGDGIPFAFRERLFEPFFTTKSDSGGTGLGLSIALGLVEQMQGHLSWENLPEGGARFEVSFPIASRQNRETSDSPEEKNLSHKTFSGRVLVVEDDATVRRVLKKQLKALGLEASTASNGLDALAKFPEFDFDVLLTDVVMPELDGPSLVKLVEKRNPNIQVVLTSGYSDSRLRKSGIEPENYCWLSKPYDRDKLKTTLDTLMAGKSSQLF